MPGCLLIYFCKSDQIFHIAHLVLLLKLICLPENTHLHLLSYLQDETFLHVALVNVLLFVPRIISERKKIIQTYVFGAPSSLKQLCTTSHCSTLLHASASANQTSMFLALEVEGGVSC